MENTKDMVTEFNRERQEAKTLKPRGKPRLDTKAYMRRYGKPRGNCLWQFNFGNGTTFSIKSDWKTVKRRALELAEAQGFPVVRLIPLRIKTRTEK